MGRKGTREVKGSEAKVPLVLVTVGKLCSVTQDKRGEYSLRLFYFKGMLKGEIQISYLFALLCLVDTVR